MTDLRIVLVDDHEVVRMGLRMLLEQMEQVTVVAEGGSAADAIHLCNIHRPDVIILDIRMPPGDSGIEACRTIADQITPYTRHHAYVICRRRTHCQRNRGGRSWIRPQTRRHRRTVAGVRCCTSGRSSVRPRHYSPCDGNDAETTGKNLLIPSPI